MTHNDIPAIRARNSTRTPGEWEAAQASTWRDGVRVVTEAFVRLPGDCAALAASIIDPATDAVSHANATFIAAASVDVPALCDEVEALRKVANAAKATHDARAACRALADDIKSDDGRAAFTAACEALTLADATMADALRAAGYEVAA